MVFRHSRHDFSRIAGDVREILHRMTFLVIHFQTFAHGNPYQSAAVAIHLIDILTARRVSIGNRMLLQRAGVDERNLHGHTDRQSIVIRHTQRSHKPTYPLVCLQRVVLQIPILEPSVQIAYPEPSVRFGQRPDAVPQQTVLSGSIAGQSRPFVQTIKPAVESTYPQTSVPRFQQSHDRNGKVIPLLRLARPDVPQKKPLIVRP